MPVYIFLFLYVKRELRETKFIYGCTICDYDAMDVTMEVISTPKFFICGVIYP